MPHPDQAHAALTPALKPSEQKPSEHQGGEAVASIYVTPDGGREFDDWKHPLPAGRHVLYTAAHQPPPLQDKQGPHSGATVLSIARHIWGECLNLKRTTDGRKHAEAHALANWVMAQAATIQKIADPHSQNPIPMVLHCPKCGMQHIDKPEVEIERWENALAASSTIKCTWTNPPHRSHLCHGCGTIWRPADVPTTGVASITTKGKADTWAPGQQTQQTQQMQAPAWSDAVCDAAFQALESRGFRVSASDIGTDDMRAVFDAMLSAANKPMGSA